MQRFIALQKNKSREDGGVTDDSCATHRTEVENRKLALEAAQRDLEGPRREYHFKFPEGSAPDAFVSRHLCDLEDKPLFYALFDMFVTSVPLAAAMFFFVPPSLGWVGHLLGFVYFAAHFGLYLQPFILALHYSSHRRLFKKGSPMEWFNAVPKYVLCPLFGIPAGMYHLHHIVMHHCEDNTKPNDGSSTEPYRRDRWTDFARYWAGFMFEVWFVLPSYAINKGYYDLCIQVLFQEAIYFTSLYYALRLNSTACIWTMCLPFFVGQFALAFGNWSQHIFVEDGKPSNYRSSYNCLDCFDNSKSFNDGYHVLHHNHSKLHWSAFPATFMKTVDRMSDEKALSFVGIGFFEVGLYVMTKRLDLLAEYAVTPCNMSPSEIAKLMESRLRPITRNKDGSTVKKTE